MTRAVKISPIASAAASAIVIESSMVIRRSRRWLQASWTIGQPPTSMPERPTTLTRGNGSHARNHTAAAASATSAMRASSRRSTWCEDS